jgi:hypothetical protein
MSNSSAYMRPVASSPFQMGSVQPSSFSQSIGGHHHQQQQQNIYHQQSAMGIQQGNFQPGISTHLGSNPGLSNTTSFHSYQQPPSIAPSLMRLITSHRLWYTHTTKSILLMDYLALPLSPLNSLICKQPLENSYRGLLRLPRYSILASNTSG